MLIFVYLALDVVLAASDETALAASVRPGIACPMYRCLPPTCPSGEVLVPQSDANGCYRCPICKPCPALYCPAATCPMEQQKIANRTNGCPGCTTCAPCHCGDKCVMNGGGAGVCQVGGDCAVNIVAPKCPGNCGKCGTPCTKNGGAGFCSINEKCVLGTVKPVCVKCLFKCPPLDCPKENQVPSPNRRGCGCPTCKCPPLPCPMLACPVEEQVPLNGACGCPSCGTRPPTPKICTVMCVNPNCPLDQQRTEGSCCPHCRVHIALSPSMPVATAPPFSAPEDGIQFGGGAQAQIAG